MMTREKAINMDHYWTYLFLHLFKTNIKKCKQMRQKPVAISTLERTATSR